MWHSATRRANRVAGAFCGLLLGLSTLAMADAAHAQRLGGQTTGTLGSLLEQLQQLQQLGGLDALEGGLTPSTALERARERGLEQASDLRQRGTPSEQALAVRRLRGGTLGPQEEVLARQFCTGQLSPRQQRAIDLIRDFSRLEQDYCQRIGELVLQHGYELFGAETAPEGLSVGAIPEGYVLGIGDELIVTFYGQENRTVTARVDREGKVLLPDWSPIAAAGRTFGEFRRELEARTASTRLGTEVFVSLGAVRALSVVVAGDVRRPGHHQLTGLSTVVDAIALADGIKKTGSVRRIHVLRDDGIFWFDAYDLLYSGVVARDLHLLDGDQIVVPPLGPTVAVAGDVRRPGIYEMSEGRSTLSIAELVALAGGALRPRGNGYLHITLDAEGREQVVERDDDQAAVANGEIVLVKRRRDVQLGSVELDGHVRVPGRRALASAQTVAQLIGDPSMLKRDPYLLFAALETADPQTRAQRLFPLNLQNIIEGKQDYALRDGDRLIVLSADEIRFLSSSDVQRIVTRRLVSERQRRESGPSTQQQPERAQAATRPPQDERLVLLDRVLGADGQQQRRPSAGDDGARGDEEDRRQIEEPELCQGLKNLAAIVSTTSAGRFASAVRLIDVTDALADSNVQDCPPIFDRFGDLLPLALEHVIAVNGEVRRPGAYPVVGEVPVTSVVAVAGGLSREVDLTRVELSRFTPDSLEGRAASSRDLVDLAKLGAEQVVLGPGDVIRFNPVFTDRDTGPVLLVGEFVRPGLYEIRRGERLSEVMQRAGGLTEQAYPYGAVFTRERVRRAQRIGFQRAARELNSALAVAAVQRGVDVNAVLALQQLSQRLDGVDALGRVVLEADPTVLQVRPEFDTVLEPGDRLFMPKRPNFVIVIGDVLNPGALQFIPGTSADQYIRQAGSYQASADEDRVFVVYPNGVAEPLAVTPWNFNPVQIPPGSAIVVPKDPAPLDLFTLVREGSQLVSQLAVTAASLAVISRD